MKGGFIFILIAIVFWAIGDLMNHQHTYPIQSIILFATGFVVLGLGLKILHTELKYPEEAEN